MIAPRVQTVKRVGQALDQPAERLIEAAAERREGEPDLFPAKPRKEWFSRSTCWSSQSTNPLPRTGEKAIQTQATSTPQTGQKLSQARQFTLATNGRVTSKGGSASDRRRSREKCARWGAGSGNGRQTPPRQAESKLGTATDCVNRTHRGETRMGAIGVQPSIKGDRVIREFEVCVFGVMHSLFVTVEGSCR